MPDKEELYLFTQLSRFNSDKAVTPIQMDSFFITTLCNLTKKPNVLMKNKDDVETFQQGVRKLGNRNGGKRGRASEWSGRGTAGGESPRNRLANPRPGERGVGELPLK